MDVKNRKKVIITNALILAALFGLISFNKEVLRPAVQDSVFFKTLTGCFPNFIAAFLISLAVVSGVFFRKPKYGRLLVYLGSLAVFTILTIEELKPMWGASTYYDLYDIIASGAGSLLAIIIYEIIVFVSGKRVGKK